MNKHKQKNKLLKIKLAGSRLAFQKISDECDQLCKRIVTLENNLEDYDELKKRCESLSKDLDKLCKEREEAIKKRNEIYEDFNDLRHRLHGAELRDKDLQRICETQAEEIVKLKETNWKLRDIKPNSIISKEYVDLSEQRCMYIPSGDGKCVSCGKTEIEHGQ